MRELNIAQIGCGYWGPNLIRCFLSNKNCHLKWVAELSKARRSFLHSQFPQIQIEEDWEEIVQNPEVDAVILATPAGSHYELAKRFLNAGKHLLVEKPLATCTSDVIKLAELADKNNLVLMAGHTFLYNPAVRFLKNTMKSELGDLYYLYSQRVNLGRLRSDINVWWNLAPHDISIFLYLMDGQLPLSIQMQGTSFLQPGIEDVVFAVLKWKSGITAHVHVSWLDPGKIRKITVVGSWKMIVYNDVEEEKIKIFDKGIDWLPPSSSMAFDQVGGVPVSHRSGDIHIPKVQMEEPLKVEAQHFIDCILQDKSCLTGPSHALDVVAILEAGEKSLQNGGHSEEISQFFPQKANLAGRE